MPKEKGYTSQKLNIVPVDKLIEDYQYHGHIEEAERCLAELNYSPERIRTAINQLTSALLYAKTNSHVFRIVSTIKAVMQYMVLIQQHVSEKELLSLVQMLNATFVVPFDLDSIKVGDKKTIDLINYLAMQLEKLLHTRTEYEKKRQTESLKPDRAAEKVKTLESKCTQELEKKRLDNQEAHKHIEAMFEQFHMLSKSYDLESAKEVIHEIIAYAQRNNIPENAITSRYAITNDLKAVLTNLDMEINYKKKCIKEAQKAIIGKLELSRSIDPNNTIIIHNAIAKLFKKFWFELYNKDCNALYAPLTQIIKDNLRSNGYLYSLAFGARYYISDANLLERKLEDYLALNLSKIPRHRLSVKCS